MIGNHNVQAVKGTAAKVKLLFDPGVVALNQAIELEERPPSKSVTQLVYTLCGIVIAGLLWSALTYVDIVTNAHGRVTPAGELVAIQHLEGGVVSQILVAEGEHVYAGQTLLKLAALDNEGRLEQLNAKRAAQLLAIEGERAIVEGRVPAFTAVISGFERQKIEQQSLYTARTQANETQRMVLNAQIAQRKAEVERLTSQLFVLRRDENIANDELALRKDLFDRKLTTRDRFYNAQRDAADRTKQRLSARDQLARAESELTEFNRKLTEFEATTRAASQEQIAKLTADLAEVDAALKNEKSRAGRLNITSPVEGIVTGLTVKAINAVVKPGESLMEIVPTNDPLVVMADVRPQDIGHVTVGQRADVRISAFDYATFGTLPGKVERISASTFSTQDGQSFYKIRVRLDGDHMNDRLDARILPGMDAEVDVKTGTRSVMAYLLKPVTRTWDTALREP